MKLTYHLVDSLPKLAWCAVVERGIGDVHVYHGSGVETFEDFFVEGAWNGEFSDGRFDKSEFFMGSGGRVVADSRLRTMMFSTPSHTLERLFSVLLANKLYVSNSLPFILNMSKSSLDINYLDYERDFNSILKGIDSYVRTIPLKDDRKLHLYYYCNISVGCELEVIETQKPSVSAFRDYSHYHDSLLETLKDLVENAQSSKREIKYGMVTTISKGYDAPACAAIARDLGCNKCVSFNQPVKYADDCGDDIARVLGFTEIIVKSAEQYLSNDYLIEAEFVSSGDLGTEIVFTAFENEFAGNIVFMGLRGDRVWDKNCPDSNGRFRFDNEVYASTSMIENRLRVGYVLLPMALFGVTEWPSITKISNSLEMEPFSIGGSYDRPIPRRIVESRGVPREMFGMKKMGAGFNYRWDNLSRIEKRMSPDSYQSFVNFVLNNRRKRIDTIVPWLRFFWSSKSQYVGYALRKVNLRYETKSVNADALVNPGAPSYLFPWGIHEMTKRYDIPSV